MNKYSEEFLDECCETLCEADEIQGNKELMKELEPKMKEKGKRMMAMGDNLKDLWKNGLKKAVEDEASAADNEEDKSERLAKEKEPKLGSKA